MKRVYCCGLVVFLGAFTLAEAQYNQPQQTQPKPFQVQPFQPIQPIQSKPFQVQPLRPIQPIQSQRIQPAKTYTPALSPNKPWTVQPLPSPKANTVPKNNLGIVNGNPYDPNSLSNPYGAGSRFKADGLKNPHSQYGSPHSSKSASNAFATEPPKLVDEKGNYLGELSSNPFRKDSVSNPHGEYGSPYSQKSINNPHGAGNPFSKKKIYVVPGTSEPKKK